MSFLPAVARCWKAAALCALGISVGLPLAWSGAPKQAPAKWWAYVGTYTGKESKGIYRFDFDPASGQLSERALAAEVATPSFLAVHPSQRFLYAVGELGKFAGKKGGAI